MLLHRRQHIQSIGTVAEPHVADDHVKRLFFDDLNRLVATFTQRHPIARRLEKLPHHLAKLLLVLDHQRMR